MSDGHMKLQINRGTGWRTLRTAEGEGRDRDLKYLRQQRASWQQNCWDFADAVYRIGFVDWDGKFEDAEQAQTV